MNDARSAYATHLLYAHRRRPSLIIQEIDIVNPSEQTLDLDLRISKQNVGNGIKRLDKQELQLDASKEKFIVTASRIALRQHNSIICVIITSQIPSNSHIKPDR